MSFHPDRERADALRVAQTLNAVTPTDAARTLGTLVAHLVSILETEDRELGHEQGCDMCQRALIYARVLSGALE